MKQEYFVLVLAHSIHGRLRRIHIPHTAVYAILALALLGCFSALGFVASYARMAWKVANYNALRREADGLRTRYQNLQKVVSQTNEQLASLEIYAKEVSAAYGIKDKLVGPADISAEGKVNPSFDESLGDYRFLKTAEVLSLESKHARILQAAGAQPSMWPVDGRLLSGFGKREDPFSGEGAMHKGVDISAPMGTAVHVAADGVVIFADSMSGFGRLIVVDHGGGIQTFYAHLSKFYVLPGHEVRRGDPIGAVGMTGRVTAPHLHYEVHINGTPMNPYRWLQHASIYQPVLHKDFPF
jgi:murein DD-endopeptidase MepM/ murein hydrolase activator NlpD